MNKTIFDDPKVTYNELTISYEKLKVVQRDLRVINSSRVQGLKRYFKFHGKRKHNFLKILKTNFF